jgi:hypothetical protein
MVGNDKRDAGAREMKQSDIKDLIERTPFRPFTIVTSVFRSITVARSEDVWLPPSRKDMAIVFEDGHLRILDTEHISELVVLQ